jgi:phosphatidate cytidylyltransferase
MLGPRVLSSVGVVLVGVVPALWGPWGVAVAFAVLGSVALTELVAMFRRVDEPVLWPITLPILLLALAATAARWPDWVFGALVAVAALGPSVILIFRTSLDGTLATWAATTLATAYLVVPLAHIVLVRGIMGETTGAGHWLTTLESHFGMASTTRGFAWFLLALVTTWLTDVGAYAAGKTVGRHKMTPVLSPNKTWEGFAGGVIVAVIVAAIANVCFGLGMRSVVALGVGLVIALTAVVGDLAESLLKRQTGVKDTGTLIPGHGGVLDRLDSQLFVFVVVYYVARAVG